MSAASISRLNHNSHLFHWRKCTSYIQIRFSFAAMILPGFSYDESSFHDSTHDEWNAAHLVTRWQRQPVLTRDRSIFEQPRKPNSSLIIYSRSFKIKHICDQNALQAKYFETEHKHYQRYHVVLSALLYDRKYNMSTYVSKPTFNIILDFVLVGLYFGSYMGLY